MHPILKLAAALFWLQTPDDVPRDITGPEIVPDIGTDGAAPSLWMAFVLGVVGVLGAIIFWAMNRRRNLRRQPETAVLRSLRQLERLDRLQLLAKGHVERHFTLLSSILRRFISRQYRIAAPRQTTDEFLDSAAACAELAKDLEFLKRFLAECDLAKFAPPAAVNGDGSRLTAELRDWLIQQKAPIPTPPLDAGSPPSKMSDS